MHPSEVSYGGVALPQGGCAFNATECVACAPEVWTRVGVAFTTLVAATGVEASTAGRRLPAGGGGGVYRRAAASTPGGPPPKETWALPKWSGLYLRRVLSWKKRLASFLRILPFTRLCSFLDSGARVAC